MIKQIFSTIIILVISFNGIAQTPQFAVVRPDGTTYICPSWDSAYNKSQDGDNVYLPGVTINSTISINKRLFIYGAGHHPDSSMITGKTSITNNILIDSGAAGGSIEGINMTGNYFGFKYSQKKFKGYLLKRCRFETIHFSLIGLPPIDSFPTNILVTECILYGIQGGGVNSIANIYTKNIIRGQLMYPAFSVIKNNIFIMQPQYCVLCGEFSNSTIENNIFLQINPLQFQTSCNNNYVNNLKIPGNLFLSGCPTSTGMESGTITVSSVNEIFIAFDPSLNNYPYIDNYHLKPTCPGVNAGTDGTDIGIYGTLTPTAEGWVPSNPHIYFKQVDDNSSTDGKLKVKYKVRTN